MRFSFRLSSIKVAIILSLYSPISSADELHEIEKIEVIGKHQAYRGNFSSLQSPEVVTEINTPLLENSGVTALTQALDLSASVSRQNSLGGLWDSFAIRGFFGDENVPSGYLVNGFNAGRGFSGPRDISAIDRIEILKGPKAPLYGRGEPSGTINLVTKKAQFESQSKISFGVGSRAKKRVDADVTGGLSDTIAARLIGFSQQGDSFRDTLDIDKKGIHASLLFQQNEDSVWQYELESARQKIPFDRGIIAIGGNFDMMPIERFLGEPNEGPTITEVLGHQLQWQYQLSNQWHINSGLSLRTTSLEGTSSDAEVSPTRQKLYYDGRTLTRQRRQRDYDTDQIVFRSELSGQFRTGSVEHEMIVGIDYDKFDYDRDYRVYRAPNLETDPTLGQLNAIDIYNPVYGQHIQPTPLPVIVRLQKQWATGLYVQDQMRLTDQLHLRLGGRFDWLEQTLDDHLTDFSAEQSENQFSPQAGIVYQLADSWSLYSSYGEGYRLNFGTDVSGQGFEPNLTHSVEIGTKFTLLNDSLNVTFALFDSSQENIIVADTVNPGYQNAIGEASSRGVEIDISGQLPADIDVWFSYAYIAAQIEKDSIDTGLGVSLKKGDALLNVPKNSASLQLGRVFMLAGKTLTFGAGATYVDERLGQRGSDFYLPSYTVVNAFAVYEVSAKLNIKAQIHNVFDRKHFTNSYTQIWVQPGEPRAVDLTATYHF